MSIKKPLHLNLWKIWLWILVVAWVAYFILPLIISGRKASGDEIVFMAVAAQLFFGLVFIAFNFIIYFIVRKSPKWRKIVGWIIVGLFILILNLPSIYRLFQEPNQHSYREFTYDEMIEFVDNCQIDRISEAGNEVSEEVRNDYKRVYLKTGENGHTMAGNIPLIEKEEGHLICK